jgi:hypothetical protein
LLKGLIKLAAAGVKAREARTDGVRRHARRAAQLFARAREQVGRTCLGLDVDWLVRVAIQLEREPPAPKASDLPAQIVFDFQLLPGSLDNARE